MWPNSGPYGTPMATQSQPQSVAAVTSSTTSDLMSTAASLRNLFGTNMSQSLFQTMGANPTATRPESTLSQLTSRRPPERTVIDYENPNYSRLDRTLMSQLSASGRDPTATNQPYSHTPAVRTAATSEARIYDPTKVPQKSILKKSKEPAYEPPIHTIDDEDNYLYGHNQSTSMSMASDLPRGIVRTDRSNLDNERPLSPISLRLKREMANMTNKTRQSPEPRLMDNWTQRLANASAPQRLADRPVLNNDWCEDEDDLILYRRRFRDGMNPSPELPSLELEKVRIQQMAAIQAGILQQSEHSSEAHRPFYPERSRTPSPRRRRSISPRRRSPISRRRTPSPRRRSPSPRRTSISPRYRRIRSPSRSLSRERYRRSRSRSPSPKKRRSIEPSAHPMPVMHPMARSMIPPYGPTHHSLVGGPMGPLMMHPMIANPYQHYIPPGITAAAPHKSISSRSASPPIKRVDKKEDKLINPLDLLTAEKTKLKSKLEDLKRQLNRKKEDQELIVKRDNGSKESYAYRNLDREIKEVESLMDENSKRFKDVAELTNEVKMSSKKAKEVMDRLKEIGDITKVVVDLKKNVIPKPKTKPVPAKKSPVKEAAKPAVKETAKPAAKKEVTVDSEDEEKTSRFYYFDSGPHWCKSCNTFSDNINTYLAHIHSKEHLIRQKESDRTPWMTKDYLREAERGSVKSKDQLTVASKGVQFIHPVQGFYCELCKESMVDHFQAQKHFRSAKHNRSYTRYTLQNSDFEHKWKLERDRAFTELKRKQRDAEQEKSRLEEQLKIEEKNRVKEELNRKEKAVREKIEAMKKSQKSVKELDDSKSEAKSSGEEKKDDKSKSSSKSSIRLNLSSKSKSSVDKCSDKLKTMGDSGDTNEGMEDMLVIDEINCEENSNTKDSEEVLDEISLLFPSESGHKDETRSDANKETNQTSDENKSEDQKSDKNQEEVEGVMPSTDPKPQSCDETNETTDQQISGEVITEDKTRPVDNTSVDNTKDNTEDISVDKDTAEEVAKEVETPGEELPNGTQKEDKPPEEVVSTEENRIKTYAEVVANGSGDQQSDKTDEPVVSDGQKIGCEQPEDKSVTKAEEPERKPLAKRESIDLFDFDCDIMKFEEQLKTFEVKRDGNDPEDDDPLDGFDVIDETKEVIELSD